MWTNVLTEREGGYTEIVLRELQHVEWAAPLLTRINAAGGVKSGTMPLLFEARYAYELHLAHYEAIYEHPSGVGTSTVDFQVAGDPPWLIELVSVRESQGLRGAEFHMGELQGYLLQSGSTDPSQSPEAEMIIVQRKIGEKVLVKGIPTKFPEPSEMIHMILVDMRSYLGVGGDWADYRQIAYGVDGITPTLSWMIHYWQNQPIKGLFEDIPNHPLHAATLIRERIHFLGFITEKEYRRGEIRERTYCLPNPHLLKTKKAQIEAYLSYPLRLDFEKTH
jgi:hypothetical protein